MSKKAKTSIRREIFCSSMIFSSIILLIFSLLLSNILYRDGMSKAYDIIKQRNYAVNFFINGYFSEINNTIEILAANKDVQKAPWLDPSARQRVLDLYKSLTKANKYITFIFSGYDNGELLINDYIPPEGFDSTTRPWYQSAMAVKPKLLTGLPYQEIKSGEWLLATGKALLSNGNGYRGVISCDSSIKMITDMLEERGDIYKSSYSFVINLSGEVILHHNKSYLKKTMSEIIGSPVALDKKEGRFIFRTDNTDKIAYYSQCNEANWIVVTVVEKKEIIKLIIWQIFYGIALTGLIAILLGFAQSILLSRRFSSPLIELRKKVKTITCGKLDEDSDYKYPDNEIGMIAMEVGQLAAHEIYIKSQELKSLNENLQQRVEEETSRRIASEGLLTQHAKMAAMGEMIGAIAHQWRQPLSTVSVIFQNLLAARRLNRLDEAYLEKATTDATALISHMSSTIDSFRNFFRPEKTRERFHVRDKIHDAAGFIRSQLKSNNITLLLPEQGGNDCTINGFPNEFAQVILNLLANARDAILDKRLSAPDHDDSITITVQPEDSTIVIEVTDTGCGIPEHAASRIFEPYFTTKDEGQGTGIGLYMSRQIIKESMRGELSFSSRPGSTTFRIELPNA